SPVRSRPKIAVLSPSVPPELNTTSASRQLKNSASVSRAWSTALRACCPCRWIDEALQNCSIQYGRIASITSGNRGVVEFASMYTRGTRGRYPYKLYGDLAFPATLPAFGVGGSPVEQERTPKALDPSMTEKLPTIQ